MHLFSHHHLLCLSLVPYLPLSLLLFLIPDRIPLHLLFSLSFHPSAHTLSSSNLTDHPLSTSKTLELRSLPSANTLLEPLDRHQHQRMSSRRSRSRQSGSTRITDEQINELISKLQAVLPEARRGGNDRVSAAKVLQETCSHIRRLHREVDDLSERLSELLDSADLNSAQAAFIRSLLM